MDDVVYDNVIVGAGPAGLTLATYLPGHNALVERHPVAGGCHRVLPQKRFVEHGPRVYSGSYANVKAVLKHIGLDWNDFFQETYYSPELIDGQHWYQWMSVSEIAWLTFEYLVYCVVPNHGKTISMKQYGACRGFREKTMDRIDLVCRWSDGAGADRYTLWQFLSGLDQHTPAFFVPAKPLDTLFRLWVRYIQRRGCTTFFSTKVVRASKNRVVTDAGTLKARRVILCVPPLYASRLLAEKDLAFEVFAKKSKYNPYWSVSFFGVSWNNSGGQRSTPYGIIAVQYPFGVVSAAATRFDVPNEHGVRLRDLTDPAEAAKEIGRQLGFENPEYAFLEGPYNDQAFVLTPEAHSVDSRRRSGVCVVGCCNGRSTYHFTSMEAAVQNALQFCGESRRTVWNLSDGVLWTAAAAAFGLLLR